MQKITKIIIPAAGLGTRFLPITKTIPKEMLPLDNKPALHHVLQEAVDAGLNKVNIIISPHKTAVIDYFSSDEKLEKILQENKKSYLLDDLTKLLSQTTIEYTIQQTAQGVGHALLQVKDFIQPNEFFAMSYPDDIIKGEQSEFIDLIKASQEHKAIIFGLTQIPKEKISAYGVINPGKFLNNNLVEIKDFAEKPTPENAPSNLAIIGRFILHHDLFKYLEKLSYHTKKETIWFDAIKMMIEDGYKVLGYQIKGHRFDTGTPEGWINCINNINKKY